MPSRYTFPSDPWVAVAPRVGPDVGKDTKSNIVASTIFSPGEIIFTGGGTDADRSEIKNFLQYVPTTEERKWIAGHLISYSFGGSGTGQNVVPLTSRANTEHLNNVEKKVEENQNVIASYFRQKSVRRYAKVLVRLHYTVCACDIDPFDAPDYLDCAVSYSYARRQKGLDAVTGESDGWSDATTGKIKWETDKDANAIMTMVNADRDNIRAEVGKLSFHDYGSANAMGVLSPLTESIIKNKH